MNKNDLKMSKIKPHFSIRKLTIGAASVLIGTTFYLGTDATTAKADSSQVAESAEAVNESATTDSDTNAVKENNELTNNSSNETTPESTKVDSQTNTQDAQSDIATADVNSSDQNTDVVTTKEQVKEAPETTSQLEVKSNEKVTDTSNLDVSTRKIVNTIADSKVATEAKTATNDTSKAVQSVKATDGNATLSIDNNKTGNTGTESNNITISFTTNKSGDYSITVPKSDIYEIDAPAIATDLGTFSKNETPKDWTFDYNIKHDGITDIGITIKTKNNYAGQPKPLADIGTTEKQITWTVNGKKQDPLTFTQTIKPQWDPRQPVRTRPDAQSAGGVQVNADVTYTLNINETPGVAPNMDYSSNRINSAANYGTTITIPVPEDFVLNGEATIKANKFEDQTTITQAGKGQDIIITVPKGSGNQGWEGKPGYQIVGKYEMAQPARDLVVSSDKKITIVQKLADGDNASTMEATLPSFTDTIIGKDTSIKIGQFSADAKGAYGTKVITTTPDDIVVNYFGIKNGTILAYNNELGIKLDFPDGLTVNKITSPVSEVNLPGTTSYGYKLTLTDGRVITGQVEAGKSVGITDGSIQSAVFTPNVFAAGATTEGLPENSINNGNDQTKYKQNTTVSAFIAYGHVNETYSNGSKIETGARLTSAISLEGGTGSASVTQTVVLPKDLEGSVGIYVYQSDKQSGVQHSGYLSLYSDLGDWQATTNEIFEPTFYYVLPANTTVNSLNLDAQVGQPKVSDFLADDGRLVVKIDYSGTGYKYNTARSANNELWLDNYPDATNGSLPWDIYVVSPETKLLKTKYSETTKDNFSTSAAVNPFNTSWVENSTDNLYHVGGGSWDIRQVSSVTSHALIKGNENASYTSEGSANDKGSSKMDIAVSIVNGSTSAIKNAVTYISVPQTSQGSGFDFKLTKAAELAGLPYTSKSGYTILYSTESSDVYSKTPDDKGFVNESEVSDWGKIKTIKVVVPELSSQSVLGRIILSGEDPTIAQDAGKTGHVKLALHALNYTYTNEANPASVKISGESTITSRYSYVDENGQTQTIALPDKTYTYKNNSDKMISEEGARNLTDADKARIPEGYILDSVELLAPTEKSWQTEAPILSPTFGGNVEYYYNNAVVQYNLVKVHTIEENKKTVTRTITYIDSTTGAVMPETLVKADPQSVTFTQYAVKDSTGKVIGYNISGNWDNGVYTSSKEANGQIKVDTTEASKSWMNPTNTKWSEVVNSDLSSRGYTDPVDEKGQAYPVVLEDTPLATSEDVKITVYYGERIIEVTPDDPKNPTDVIPGTKVNYPEGVDQTDLNKEITRTITVYDATGKQVENTDQVVNYTRIATVNVVTGETTYTDWTSTKPAWDAYMPTLAAGQGIERVTDGTDKDYADTIKDAGKVTGVASKAISSKATNENDEKVNIYLNQAVNFNGQRVITYTTYDKDGNVVESKQDAQPGSVTGTQYYDLTNKKTVYRFDNPDVTYQAVQVSVKPGYYALTTAVEKQTVAINKDNPQDSDLNATAEVVYRPMGYLIQVDKNGNQISGTTPVIYANDQSDPTKAGKVTVPAAPTGWVIVDPKQNASFTPVDPGEDTKVVYEKLNNVVAHTNTVTRIINYVDSTTGAAMPENLVKTDNQSVTFTQYAVIDETGKVLGYNTSGSWENGVYVPSKELNGQIKVDTTDETKSWLNLNNAKWTSVKNPDLKRKGYSGPTDDKNNSYLEVLEETPAGNDHDKTITVYYSEDVITVNPDDPKKSTDLIPDTDVHYPTGVDKNDLNKTFTRTINIYDVNGNLVSSTPQEVVYTRIATVNVVTGKTTYTDWTSTKDIWNESTPTLSTGQGIEQITDVNDHDYDAVIKNATGQLTGVDARKVLFNDSDEVVNVYLNQVVDFNGQRVITYTTYDKEGNVVESKQDTQNVTVAGTQYYDLANKKTAYRFDNPDATYQAVKVPVKDGYYASSVQVASQLVTINKDNPQNSDLDATAEVVYRPMGHLIQVDRDGNQIPDTALVIYPNNSNDPTKASEVTVPATPNGWVIVDPTQSASFTPVNPGEDTKVVYEKLNDVVAHTNTVTRTISYVDSTTGTAMPETLVKADPQSVTFTQYEVKDSTGKVLGYNTSGSWENGVYIPSKEVNGQIKIDTTEASKSWMNPTNTKWEKVTNPDLSKHGYTDPVDGNGQAYPIVSEETPSATGEDVKITVYYGEKVIEVTPDDPKKPTDTIPGTDIKYPNGVDQTGLNQAITRTITVYDATGKQVSATDQVVNYTRVATVNVVTGKTSYTDWKSTKPAWDAYVPTLSDGQKVEQVTDGAGNDYAGAVKDTDQVTGIAGKDISSNANNEKVNIYLNQAIRFNGQRVITYTTYDREGNAVDSKQDVQNVSVDGTQYYDLANKKTAYRFDNPNATYQVVQVPVKDGYYASTATVAEKVVTINGENPQDGDLNATAEVAYRPMGHLIQVDADGNQISGTTPVIYSNDPSDPTKASVVTVPKTPAGWVIVDPKQNDSFTPVNPGEDTKVVYEKIHEVGQETKDVIRTINYINKTTGQPMPNNLVKSEVQNVTLTRYVVKDAQGKVLGYNTSGSLDNGVYVPSKEVNGQIKVDTTDENKAWMNLANQKWAAVTNPDLSSSNYSGPFKEDGTTPYPVVEEVTPGQTSQNIVVNVYYVEQTTPDNPPVNPDTPDTPVVPDQPTNPNTPATPDQPSVPDNIQPKGEDDLVVPDSDDVKTVKPKSTTVELVDSKVKNKSGQSIIEESTHSQTKNIRPLGQTKPNAVEKTKEAENQLPQTGDNNGFLASILGLGSILISMITGTWTSKKKKK